MGSPARARQELDTACFKGKQAQSGWVMVGTQPTGRLINNQGKLVGLYHTVRPTKPVKSVRYVIKQHGTDDDVMMGQKIQRPTDRLATQVHTSKGGPQVLHSPILNNRGLYNYITHVTVLPGMFLANQNWCLYIYIWYQYSEGFTGAQCWHPAM